VIVAKQWVPVIVLPAPLWQEHDTDKLGEKHENSSWGCPRIEAGTTRLQSRNASQSTAMFSDVHEIIVDCKVQKILYHRVQFVAAKADIGRGAAVGL
jgi:hypothetical protein